MELKKRFKYYFIGLLLGGLLTFFIFKGRGCNWLPGKRVKETIETSKIIISDKDKCLLDCNHISNETVYQLIDEGSISFGESDTKVRNYQFTHKDLVLFIKINKSDTTAVINRIDLPNSACSCSDADENAYQLLYQPNSFVLKKLRELSLSIKKNVQCELDCFGITTADIDSMFVNGTVLFNQSYPNRIPNPLYYIQYQTKKGIYLFWLEQGATKTRLKHVVQYNPNSVAKGELLENVFNKSYQLKDCNCN